MGLLKNQRGMAAIGIVVIVVVCLAVIGGIVWFALNRGSTNLPLVGSKFNDKCEYGDKELCKFLNNFKEQNNYTVKSVSTNADGTKYESTYLLDGTDRFQLISGSSGKEEYNYISIGNTTYTKDYSDNAWFKQTTEPAAQEELKDDYQFDDTTTNESGQEVKVSYVFVAEEKCDDKTCLKYEVVTTGSDTKEYIWFDTKEYLTRKTLTTSSDGTKSESTYSYAEVTISEPSPTKDMPASPSISIPELTPSTEVDPSTVDYNIDYSQIPAE